MQDESLWTVPIFRQWTLSFRAFIRSADKSLRDFLKGRHGVFLRGVIRVEVPEPRSWRRAGTKLVLRSAAEEDELDRLI